MKDISKIKNTFIFITPVHAVNVFEYHRDSF